MSDKEKEPIDFQKRRAEKLLEQESCRKNGQVGLIKENWPGAKFIEEAESMEFTEELLDRLKIMIQAISSKIREANTMDDVERSCFGLALLLLRDLDQEAYDKLFTLIKEREDGR